ncbi:hypothetical protein HYC85_026055 [Camellia sinensis]|uniref:Uncharacterized protein n=1 Tax=Camellia sinensis TaxID=4442 RepID=A0A7J7G6I3_CAMSI|nr:hypothetical protein HYC85_026055 [Camellia sinensis]
MRILNREEEKLRQTSNIMKNNKMKNSRASRRRTTSSNPQPNGSKISEISKDSENSNPNLTSPSMKVSNSPAIKSASKTQKSASKVSITIQNTNRLNTYIHAIIYIYIYIKALNVDDQIIYIYIYIGGWC